MLVLDDASTDGTAAIVQSFDDSRIQYHALERTGSCYRVRNAGLRLATGDLIAFLDADDLFFGDTLFKLSAKLLEDDHTAVVMGFPFTINEQGKPLAKDKVLIPLPQGGYALPPGDLWDHLLTGSMGCYLPALMMRRSVVETVGPFDDTLNANGDFQYAIRLLEKLGPAVVCLPDYIYQYRVYATSLTKNHQRYREVLASSLAVLRWVYGEANIPVKYKARASQAFARRYKTLARDHLLQGQGPIVREFVLAAWEDPQVKPWDWLRACAPLFLRSWIPPAWDQALIRWRQAVRRKTNLWRLPQKVNTTCSTPP